MKFSEMNEKELENLMSGDGIVKGGKGKGKGRKEEILGMLKEEILSNKEISERLAISNRNVSSIKCYLMDDGYRFREMGDKLVLWGVIRGGEKIGNRVEMGKSGKLVRFNFKEGKFEDEIKKM